jgi:hypothetical protein
MHRKYKRPLFHGIIQKDVTASNPTKAAAAAVVKTEAAAPLEAAEVDPSPVFAPGVPSPSPPPNS